MLNNKDIANAIGISDSLISSGILLPSPEDEAISDLALGTIIGIIASKLEQIRNTDSGAIKDLPGTTFKFTDEEVERINSAGRDFTGEDNIEKLTNENEALKQTVAQLEAEKEELAKVNAQLTNIIKEMSSGSNCPVEYFIDEGYSHAIFGTSAIAYVKELRAKLKNQ
jgi:hypothetical protein